MKQLAIIAFAVLLVAACGAPDPADGQSGVVARSLESAVQLFAEREGGMRRAGSGVVLAREADGQVYILTAGHLVEPPVEQTVYVVDPGGTGLIAVDILATDTRTDLALLAARGIPARPVTLQVEARLGDPVWAISFPWGRRGTLVSGIVSQVAVAGTTPYQPVGGPVRLIDAAVSHGSSGGGVFNSRTGALVGIIRGYRTAKLAFAGAEAGSLDLPIAGETTVVPTSEILCLVRDAGLRHVVPAALWSESAITESCATDQDSDQVGGRGLQHALGFPTAS